jgi:hypothetical protein
MYGIKENKPRYGNLCLPTSVNASVIALKQLSRRVKMEIDRHPFPVKRHILSQTWLDINKVLQRTRQLEADHIAIEKYETNVGRKKYQSSLIAQAKNDPAFVTVSKKDMPSFLNRRGITVAVGDIYKPLSSIDKEFIVTGIGLFVNLSGIPLRNLNRENTYMITIKERNVPKDQKAYSYTLPIHIIAETMYLHDVAFFDTDYTPDYCENCDTYHNAWANDGGFKLND